MPLLWCATGATDLVGGGGGRRASVCRAQTFTALRRESIWYQRRQLQVHVPRYVAAVGVPHRRGTSRQARLLSRGRAFHTEVRCSSTTNSCNRRHPSEQQRYQQLWPAHTEPPLVQALRFSEFDYVLFTRGEHELAFQKLGAHIARDQATGL